MVPPPSFVAVIAQADDVGLGELPCVVGSVFEIVATIGAFGDYAVVDGEDAGVGAGVLGYGIRFRAAILKIIGQDAGAMPRDAENARNADLHVGI